MGFQCLVDVRDGLFAADDADFEVVRSGFEGGHDEQQQHADENDGEAQGESDGANELFAGGCEFDVLVVFVQLCGWVFGGLRVRGLVPAECSQVAVEWCRPWGNASFLVVEENPPLVAVEELFTRLGWKSKAQGGPAT